MPKKHQMLTTWRRRLFYVWITAAVIAFAIIGIAGPMEAVDGSAGTTWIALLAPIPSMIFAAAGIAWLTLLVMSHDSKYVNQPPN